MKRDPELEAIVAAGMEESLPGDPSAPLVSDPRVAQFRRIGKQIRLRHFEAPQDLIAAAMNLMPELERRQIWAKRTSGSLSLAGARAAASDSFQMVFEADGARARMMYVRDARGWEVTGQATDGWSVLRDGKPIKVDSRGRFAFRTRELARTGISLVDPSREILIPSAEQADSDESGNPH